MESLAEPGLGIPHGRRAVAVHGAEVALALHQHIAGVKILGQAHHGVVHGTVPVGMIFTKHVAHDTGGFAVRLVRRNAQLDHGIENAPVHGLQAVPHVRQGAADDDRHGVGNKGFFQLLLDVPGLQAAGVVDVFKFIQGFVLPSVKIAFGLNIQIGHQLGVLFNELPPGLHLVAHQQRKQLVRARWRPSAST